jgi:hypothetical protein
MVLINAIVAMVAFVAMSTVFPVIATVVKSVIVRYHFGGSMVLNARILLLAYMVYL